MELIYRIFAELARIIYFLVSQILLLIDNLSKYHFFSPDSINNFTTKIYVIVGVLMLFKLVISAVQYLVNPEQLADKNKGLSSILTKAVVAVALLVLVPSIFEYALEIQDVVVEAIPRFILSDKNGNSTNQISMKQASENISMTVIEGFLQPKEGKVPTKSIEGVDKIPEVVLDGCNAWFFSGEFWTGANCIYDFTWLLIVPIGIYFVFITLSMAIDIGIRAIKLGIVQILAPIPIVSYISDEKKFNTWVKTSVKVYADLFIRMAVIYLVIYFINVIITSTFGHTGYPTEFAQRIGRTPEPMEIVFVKVAIIIALLLFAKDAPKFICDLLGVDTGDDSIANMFKRAGGMFGATAALPGRYRATKRNEMNRLTSKYGKAKNDDGSLKTYDEMTRRERRQMLRDAAADGHKRSHTLANTLRAAGSGYAHGMYDSISANKGYKEARSSVRAAADRSYAISKAIDDKGITRSQYRHAVHEQRLGIESSYTAGSEEAKAARAIADAAKASLDLGHTQLIDKQGDVILTNEYVNQLLNLKNADGSANDKYIKALRKAMEFDIANENGSHNFHMDLGLLTSGAYSLGDVQMKLQSIIDDNTGTYDAIAKRKAKTKLDDFNGEYDKFAQAQEMYALAHPNATLASGYKHNPAFANSMQSMIDTFGTYASTPFGKRMIEEGIKAGILDPTNNNKPYAGLEGLWVNMIKGAGLDEERSANAQMGPKELAAMSAEEIAKQFDNKKS